MINLLAKPVAYWASGGPLLMPLALVCFGIWLYLLKSRHSLVSILEQGDGIEERLLDGLSSGSPESCRRELAAGPDFFSAVLAGALGDVLRGVKPSEAFDARVFDPLRGLTRDFVVVAALTAAAPLLGLLGTVSGMIDTFDAVSLVGGGTAERVASGISRALITTQYGLVVAIPGVIGLSMLHRLLAQLKMRLALCKTHLLLGLSRNMFWRGGCYGAPDAA